jgi:hypothetical protein
VLGFLGDALVAQRIEQEPSNGFLRLGQFPVNPGFLRSGQAFSLRCERISWNLLESKRSGLEV